MKYVILLLFFSQALLAQSDWKRPWPRQSSPTIMGKHFEHRFSELPLVGMVLGQKKFWSSWYWPLMLGNINYRWNAQNPVGFNLESPDYKDALGMKLHELKALSPSEKYDLLVGDYSYSLKREVEKRVSPRRKEWEGICHGWAGAALNHDEPEPKILRNPDGIRIPFGSSDIKGLLSYYYAYHHRGFSTHQTGRRCRGRTHCKEDMNAGAFHIILTNKVGKEGQGFIADIENGREVWNQVVYSYRTSIVDDNLRPMRSSAKGTVKMIRVKTIMRVVFNIVRNSWEPVRGTPLQTFKELNYEYDLDINKDGKIIGGSWRSKERPDFLWTMPPETKFTGILERLGLLL